jgi:hypothetical protein
MYVTSRTIDALLFSRTQQKIKFLLTCKNTRVSTHKCSEHHEQDHEVDHE